MQALARAARGLWPAAAEGTSAAAGRGHYGQVQPSRGIMVQVRDGNLERALQVMERKMRSSGIERLIKRRTEHHVKNSEKRVLAHKALMARVRSQELGKKLREILIKKIRSVPPILPPLSPSRVSESISQCAAFFSNTHCTTGKLLAVILHGCSMLNM
ncbi:hypothetical protein ACQ4PT_037388 [Festuca glaucescens]